MSEIFCGIDWSSRHHDVALVDQDGHRVAKLRIDNTATGFADLMNLFAQHDLRPDTLKIAIETEHGLLVSMLAAAGYAIYPINPKSVDRYRDRHHRAHGKSDVADALVLAHLLRTDAHLHRRLAADSTTIRVLQVLTRTHQDLIWSRVQEVNRLKALLSQYFPAALIAFPDLTIRTACVVLTAAPTPTQAARLTTEELTELLFTAGWGRRHSAASRLAAVFSTEQMRQPEAVERAFGLALTALLETISAMTTAIAGLEAEMDRTLDQHSDAIIYRSQPGLGTILAARILAEFGDDLDRWPDALSRRAYAGTAPITRQSGKKRLVTARFIRNKRLYDAVRAQAFCALHFSPGARAFYDQRRAAGDGHEAALRRLAGKLLGQLHHCLRHRVAYQEDRAWTPRPTCQVDSCAA
jgi:transposase